MAACRTLGKESYGPTRRWDMRGERGESPGCGWRGGAVSAASAGPSARLGRLLHRLDAIVERSPFQVPVAAKTTRHSVHVRCSLHPPAAQQTIEEAELQLGSPLPDDYRC